MYVSSFTTENETRKANVKTRQLPACGTVSPLADAALSSDDAQACGRNEVGGPSRCRPEGLCRGQRGLLEGVGEDDFVDWRPVTPHVRTVRLTFGMTGVERLWDHPRSPFRPALSRAGYSEKGGFAPFPRKRMHGGQPALTVCGTLSPQEGRGE